MKKFLFILILLAAAFLRFWQLGSYPALNADEAAIGYNAYSLIQTGKDEHANPWPIHFQSFNDFKPGFYFYLVLPFVKLIGLNEWAVRIPGALLGVATVAVVYFLVKKLFESERLALVAGLFLAISPWHIHFSRGGWEVNAATFLLSLGVLCFVHALDKPRYFMGFVLSWVLALYDYHAARIVIPLLGASLLIIYGERLRENLKEFVVALVVGAVLLLPLARDLLGEAGVSRAAGVGLFADVGPFNRVNEQRGEHADFTSLTTKLLHNKPVNYALAFFQNWAEHYHGEFLFLSGDDIQRNKVPETGQMYILDGLFVILGLILMAKSLHGKGYQLILSWLIIGPVAAALTFQSPHALRAHNLVIPLTIISALGFGALLDALSSRKIWGKVLIGGMAALILWQFGRYQEMYWNHLSREYPFSSQYGVKELVSYLSSGVGEKYKKIVVTDRYDQPYILFLFYLKYDPAKFQTGHELTARDQYGFSTVRNFDKYVFISIFDWDSLRTEYRDSLVVGTDAEIFEGTNVIKDIYGGNGYKYFQVVAN